MAGIYAAVFVKESRELREYVARHNIPQAQEDRQRLHVTVFHTSKSAHLLRNIQRANTVHVAQACGWITLPHGDKTCLALELKCDSLLARFKQLEAMGLEHKYPEFIPHLTLSYDIGDYLKYHSLPPLPGPIILHNEAVVKASRRFFHDNEYWDRLQIHLREYKRTIIQTEKEENDRCVLA